MRSGSKEATEIIARLAATQHGVVARRQALNQGISPELLDRRIASGRYFPVFRGVFAAGPAQLSRRGRWQAAVLAAGDAAVLSGKSAAALHGLLNVESGPIEVVRPGNSTRFVSEPLPADPRFHVRVFRSDYLPESDLQIIDGISVISVARTYLDIASRVSESRLFSAFAKGEQMRLVDWSEVRRISERGRGWTGSQKLKRALNVWTPLEAETASELERVFLRLCNSAQVELPRVNALVNGFIVDFFWVDQKLIVEVDGFAHHSNWTSFKSDRSRDAALVLAGYRVVRFTYADLVEDPVGSARRIRELVLQSLPEIRG